MRFILTSLILVICFSASAQLAQAEYLEAKRQYGLGNYRVAQLAFQDLTEDNVFGEYASFYYALASLKLGQPKVAEDMWRQIRYKSPNWEKQFEVDYWLAYVAFTQNNIRTGLERSEVLPSDWKNFLIDAFLSKMSLSELASAYKLNPESSEIASYYAQAINALPYEERDYPLLRELSEKFDTPVKKETSWPVVKKEAYSIAVVLPFMFESVSNPQTVIRNSIIFDLYQGMNMAQKHLRKENINLELYPFDTKKRGSSTYELVNNGYLDSADVIVGPLYAKPSEIVSAFSAENGIPMINPVSSNDQLLRKNPYSLLFKPSYETQGRIAAKFAAKTFTDNKKLFIFYETDRDSLMARSYLEAIQQEGFFVVRFDRLTNEDAQQIQKDFTEQYEVRLDTMYSQEEIDSLGTLPGRIVRSRSLRNERTGRIIRDNSGNEVTEYYEVKFTIQPDSIGHIFAATSSNLLANNFISMVEVRSDTIGIIGYENWLEFSLVSYDQLERLQINFVSPSYVDTETAVYQEVRRQFIEETGTAPSEYHIYGYELIWQLGKLMKENGKYFQQGLEGNDALPGYLMEGIKYGPFQDNQVVPITTLKNLRLVNQHILGEANESNENNDQ